MLRLVFLLMMVVCGRTVFAQYYFQDIVSANNSAKNFLSLKKNAVKKVTVTSIEPDGNETEGFGISQTVNSANNILVTISTATVAGSSTTTAQFNTAGLPESLVDSTNKTVNTVRYSYDAAGRLVSLNSASHEPEDTSNYTIREDHFFQYGGNGQLTGMLKIINNTDTLKVVFIPAENGLPGEEQWFKKGRKTETWFYYYDDKNHLTDIVRYNAAAQKMLPDYIFEYNDAGNISQQTVVQPGTNFYRLWMYEYNDKGLKKAETIFKKGKEQEGRIIYEYE